MVCLAPAAYRIPAPLSGILPAMVKAFEVPRFVPKANPKVNGEEIGVSRRLVQIRNGCVSVLKETGTREEFYRDRDRLRAAEPNGSRFEVWALRWECSKMGV
jgi:hypothetical protein